MAKSNKPKASDVFCTAKGCPIKDRCNRVLQGAAEKYKNKSKINIIPPPFKIVHKKFECELFLGNPEDLLLFQLKNLLYRG